MPILGRSTPELVMVFSFLLLLPIFSQVHQTETGVLHLVGPKFWTLVSSKYQPWNLRQRWKTTLVHKSCKLDGRDMISSSLSAAWAACIQRSHDVKSITTTIHVRPALG